MKNQANLEVKRHSLEHVMVLAVRRLYDENVKLGVGPVIENGFYQDFDYKFNEEDLAKIEAEMHAVIAEDLPFERKLMDIDEAITMFKERGQQFKVELLTDIKEKGTSKVKSAEESEEVKGLLAEGKVSIYSVGIHTDLCRGPHVASTGELKGMAFKLDRLAGAYWRGNEKNPMLTRIYGVAFEKKSELDAYYEQLEQARERDHRKIGKEQDLFFISDLVGGGLNLWTPKGTVLREELDSFVWQLRKRKGYQKVAIPHITKRDLYETSGHWDKFSTELFRIETREGDEFAMKPMNCPHHTQIYDHVRRSYRELPQRYAETTMVYRDEQSGELSGLARVRAITQDDAHVFCRKNQIGQEFNAIWDIIEEFYGAFGLKMRMRLSFHDPENFGAYLGSPEVWKESEEILEKLAKERGYDYFIAKGEAAMYGPKTDFMAEDSLGREHQVATVQLDMNLPERFDLYCINEQGEKERIVMLHAAIMGSIERFCSVMIEHLAGAFPLWLSPVQLAILPISEDQHAYAQSVMDQLQEVAGKVRMEFRAQIDDRAEMLPGKIRDAAGQKIPYVVVVGKREAEEGTVAVRMRGDRAQKVMKVEDFANALLAKYQDRELGLEL
jgi:threonyl-tRNA synthetase